MGKYSQWLDGHWIRRFSQPLKQLAQQTWEPLKD